nr:polysaccharide deacetylase family protein [Haloferax larsenii]
MDWPDEPTIFLTLDFECDYGTALTENYYGAVEQISDLVGLIEKHEVPITAFTQTELLDVKPEAVEKLRNSETQVEFHPHSHTHQPRESTSVRKEIEKSTEKYRDFFGHDPTGYRFPNGNIKSRDYRYLSQLGYEFDASVFPSWRPNHFDNRDLPTRPHRISNYDLYEVPFTVYSRNIRLPTALSYIRLVGRPFSMLLEQRTPSAVVFNIHMHDLVNPKSYSRLPAFYKAIYSRNNRGMELLDRFLTVTSSTHKFKCIDTLVGELQTK